ncbi:RHS repeat-associated core domain-containing protein, partial [Metapseudomonas otitidis]
KASYYVWLDSLPIAQIDLTYSAGTTIASTTLTYLHSDHLNTPRLATNQSGDLVWSWQSDAFGVGQPKTYGSTIDVILRFPGQVADAHSGLYYNYFRDYDPETGRYVESDPIGLKGGLNTFGYVSSNPLLNYDRKGLYGQSLIIPAVAIGGAAALTCYITGTCQKLAQTCRSLLNESSEDDWEREYEDYLNSGDSGLTDHGKERANDPTRDVGDRNDTIKNGEKFKDTETGATVYVDGNRVVIIGDRGGVTQWNDQTERETSNKVSSGKWKPLE